MVLLPLLLVVLPHHFHAMRRKRPLVRRTPMKRVSKRGRAIRKKDREFQLRYAGGEGVCECCTRWCEERVAHHIIRRANLQYRWDRNNVVICCHPCHSKIHSLGPTRFVEELRRNGIEVDSLLPILLNNGMHGH